LGLNQKTVTCLKKIILSLLSIGFLAALAVGIWLALAIQNAASPGPLTEEKIILIEKGMGVSSIAQRLETENIIESALVFKILSRIDGNTRPLKAGEYQFLPAVPMADALEKMRKGEVYDRKVTFPEGVTSWQIVQTLKSLSDMAGDIADVPAEGTLLPDTYHYILNEDRAGLIAKMKDAMDKTLAELWPAREEGLPVANEKEALVLASIVEKETGVAAERKKVAGVFINRLRRGMPLQSDPTVIYGVTKGEVDDAGLGPLGRRLLSKDLQEDSPYNTYTRNGLPPTPIANPGRASIEAVLHPEKHDYIYFVADGTGGHVFARTLEEHNRNVANWRRIRRTQE
jgi:UPF0755 protein